jgi:hypothetical protein
MALMGWGYCEAQADQPYFQNSFDWVLACDIRVNITPHVREFTHVVLTMMMLQNLIALAWGYHTHSHTHTLPFRLTPSAVCQVEHSGWRLCGWCMSHTLCLVLADFDILFEAALLYSSWKFSHTLWCTPHWHSPSRLESFPAEISALNGRNGISY